MGQPHFADTNPPLKRVRPISSALVTVADPLRSTANLCSSTKLLGPFTVSMLPGFHLAPDSLLKMPRQILFPISACLDIKLQRVYNEGLSLSI